MYLHWGKKNTPLQWNAFNSKQLDSTISNCTVITQTALNISVKKQGNLWKSFKAIDKLSKCLSDLWFCVSEQFPAGHHYSPTSEHDEKMCFGCTYYCSKVLTQWQNGNRKVWHNKGLCILQHCLYGTKEIATMFLIIKHWVILRWGKISLIAIRYILHVSSLPVITIIMTLLHG